MADPERSPRELAWQLTDRDGHFLSESSVYRILKAYDLIPSPAFIVLSAAKTFQHPTHRPNELWQTDFTYLQVVAWGWYYLSTVLDDYSRYIIAWTLQTSMQASDVTETLDLARAKTGVDRVRVAHRPRLLSDNGPCYVSGELADYLETHKITHTRGAPYHPMTQGKIERYHRSMKNVVKLEHYYSPWEFELVQPDRWLVLRPLPGDRRALADGSGFLTLRYCRVDSQREPKCAGGGSLERTRLARRQANERRIFDEALLCPASNSLTGSGGVSWRATSVPPHRRISCCPRASRIPGSSRESHPGVIPDYPGISRIKTWVMPS